MHELSIAESLMDQIEDIAKTNNLVSVDAIQIESGILRQVIPDVMQAAFEAVKKDTICENAILTIFEISALATCRQCKCEFEPSIDDFTCKKCNIANVDIIKGNEIILKAVSGKTEKERETSDES